MTLFQNESTEIDVPRKRFHDECQLLQQVYRYFPGWVDNVDHDPDSWRVA